MEIVHVREAVDAILADYKQGAIVAKLDALVSAYSASVQSPSAQTADAFDGALEGLRHAVKGGRCQRLSQSRQQVLKRIGGAALCGDELVTAVMRALKDSPTPASAIEHLQELRTSVAALQETLTNLRDALNKLKVRAEKGNPDLALVEVSIPGSIFDTNLGPLGKETQLLNRALQDIGEVVNGERPQIKVEGAGTGSVEFYLSVDLGSGAALITLVTAIVNLVNATIELRKKRSALEDSGAPKEVLDPLKSWEDERVEAELKRLVDEAIKGSPLEKGRKAEMKKALSNSLQYLADRIDRGMDVDVVVEPSAEQQAATAEDGTAGAVLPEDTARQTISESSGAIKRLNRGSEPVLRLSSPQPEPDDE